MSLCPSSATISLSAISHASSADVGGDVGGDSQTASQPARQADRGDASCQQHAPAQRPCGTPSSAAGKEPLSATLACAHRQISVSASEPCIASQHPCGRAHGVHETVKTTTTTTTRRRRRRGRLQWLAGQARASWWSPRSSSYLQVQPLQSAASRSRPLWRHGARQLVEAQVDPPQLRQAAVRRRQRARQRVHVEPELLQCRERCELGRQRALEATSDPCSQDGYLLRRGGCQNRWHSLLNCDHGDSTTSRFDSPRACAPAAAAVVALAAALAAASSSSLSSAKDGGGGGALGESSKEGSSPVNPSTFSVRTRGGW
jgi:hypothetical protein